MRAGIYLRVSSEEQAQHGYSIAAQRKECHERARRLGADDIVEYADEGISASVLDRPGLQALRMAIGRGEVQLVVIHDPDRFARNLSHQLLVTEEIERAGARLDFVNFEWRNTPEGKLFYSLRGAIAEYEREKIRLRTMTGRTQKAREGKLPFGFAPYGYRYVAERSQLEIVEQEAVIVRFIFDQYTLGGRGLNAIAWDLTGRGIPTRKNRSVWHRQVVRQIVRNPAYMGVYWANRHDMAGMGLNRYRAAGEKVHSQERDPGEWIAVPVPGLIAEAQWLEGQRLMAEHARPWRGGACAYLLSGLLRCGLCGQTMTGRRARSWGTVVRQYTCRKHTAGARSPGCGRGVGAEQIDHVVWERVMAWLHDPRRVAAGLLPRADTSRTEHDLEQTRQEVKRVQRSQRDLLAVLERGLASGDDVLDGLRRLKYRETALRAQLAGLTAALAAAGGAESDPQVLVGLAATWLRRAHDELPVQWRRRIVEAFIARITVESDCLTIHARIVDPKDAPPAAGLH